MSGLPSSSNLGNVVVSPETYEALVGHPWTPEDNEQVLVTQIGGPISVPGPPPQPGAEMDDFRNGFLDGFNACNNLGLRAALMPDGSYKVFQAPGQGG